jgi:23S rRNA (uridine2552-2'-O)-methyltransferase
VARRGSSGRWLERQRSDRYVRERGAAGLRSRAAYKLQQLDQRDQLIRPGANVLDLGAAPGGWTQVAVAAAGPRGTVVALDLLPMEPVPGALCITGDCREPALMQTVETALAGRRLDLVMSDMAPNITGIAPIDEAAALELARMSLEFARRLLRPGGALLIKLFQFSDTQSLLREIGTDFAEVLRRKPAASRAESREFYVVARRYGI